MCLQNSGPVPKMNCGKLDFHSTWFAGEKSKRHKIQTFLKNFEQRFFGESWWGATKADRILTINRDVMLPQIREVSIAPDTSGRHKVEVCRFCSIKFSQYFRQSSTQYSLNCGQSIFERSLRSVVVCAAAFGRLFLCFHFFVVHQSYFASMKIVSFLRICAN
jgi:hypothetical protein